MKNILFSLGILAFTLNAGCKKEEYNPPSDPAKAILGKWEMIAMGNLPTLEPYQDTGYTEYLSDSLIRVYTYSTKEYKYLKEKYWIDSLLHLGIRRGDGVLVSTNYKFKFYGEKLQLDFNGSAIWVTSQYKRVK